VKRLAALGLLIAASLVVLSGQTTQTPPAAPPQQTFRASTDAVIVDASVRAGGKMLAELAIGDFELTDNGVKQTIESVEHASVPIDLTLIVDTSGNPAGAWTEWVDKKKVAHSIDGEVRQIANLLRPTDRVRVLAIDRYVRQINGFTPVSALRPVRLVEIDGLGSVYDTLTAALLHDVEPWRRHVVIARTKGRDSMSSASAKAVGAIAERSDALFHLVVMETALDNEAALHSFQAQPANMGLIWPTHRFWIPARRQLVERDAGLFEGPENHPLTLDGRAIQDGLRAGWRRLASDDRIQRANVGQHLQARIRAAPPGICFAVHASRCDRERLAHHQRNRAEDPWRRGQLTSRLWHRASAGTCTTSDSSGSQDAA
jgi:hypothetical protein